MDQSGVNFWHKLQVARRAFRTDEIEDMGVILKVCVQL
jgi:hypothetical protein